MSPTTSYPSGVPCWVDTLQPDPEAAALFYGSLLGWTFDGPVAMADGLTGEYRTARSDGRLVAGIGQAPPGFPSAVCTTYVAAFGPSARRRRATVFSWPERHVTDHSVKFLGVSVVVAWLVVKLGVDGAVLAESLDR